MQTSPFLSHMVIGGGAMFPTREGIGCPDENRDAVRPSFMILQIPECPGVADAAT